MKNYHRTVGKVELISLTDGFGKGRPTSIFPDSSLDIWLEEYSELLYPDGFIRPRYGSCVIRSEGKVILVDTGDGPPDGNLIRDMTDKGINPGEIDLVIITHLHGDHVGWNLTDNRATFSNAQYLISKVDWEYWTNLGTEPHVREQVLPLEDMGILDLIEDEYIITDELTTVSTPVHTPVHFSISIYSSGEKGFILGDVAHSPSQAQYTHWNPTLDVDPNLAYNTRKKIFARLENEGTLVSAGHFPDTGFGRLIRESHRRYWQVI